MKCVLHVGTLNQPSNGSHTDTLAFNLHVYLYGSETRTYFKVESPVSNSRMTYRLRSLISSQTGSSLEVYQ